MLHLFIQCSLKDLTILNNKIFTYGLYKSILVFINYKIFFTSLYSDVGYSSMTVKILISIEKI